MAQQVKLLATKPDRQPEFDPRIYMVKGRTDSQIPSDFHVYTMAFVGPHVEVCVCCMINKCARLKK